MAKAIRIGGASGFWGDSSVGAPQLLAAGVDFLVFDYLAELTLSIMAAARRKDPRLGWATDFVDITLREILPQAVAGGTRIVSNAGGLNPQACADAVRALAAGLNLSVKVAVVLGDDLKTELADDPLHAGLATANAYLGALPVRAALDAGAQIVITGRCVDSAVTLGALMHAFGWAEDDWDRLAQGSLAGHLIECGCQATGGLHTDWERVPGWPHIGYPILECEADGRFVLTKPAGTGGLVDCAVAAEQLLYEIGDPRRYLLPDVSCDFTQVRLRQVGEHRVAVEGARGSAPGPQYKVSATQLDGFRCTAQLTIVGEQAARKAQRTGEAILARCRALFAARGWADFGRTRIECLGSEHSNFGPHAQGQAVREVVLHLAVTHAQREPLELFAREIAPAGTSWSPGTTGAGGRPSPAPLIRQRALMIDKARLAPRVLLEGRTLPVAVPAGQAALAPWPPASAATGEAGGTDTGAAAPTRQVPLIALAYARSGDKGDTSNIGVIARRPEWLPLLAAQLTPERVAAWLAHLVRGPVTRHDLPGIHAFNFVCEQALDGGGMASLRNDPLGKGMAQILLAMPLVISCDLFVRESRRHELAASTL